MKVLLYSPFANVWDHSFPEALVAEGLVAQGAEVVAVRCAGMLGAHCISMAAAAVPDDAPQRAKDQVCRACIKRRDLLSETMPFRTLVMDDRITPEDRAFAADFAASATPDNWTSLELDGVPIGRYSAYEVLLNHKLVGTDIPDALFPRYAAQLYQAVLVHVVALRLLEEERPTHVLVYNRLYSANHAVAAAADRFGIPTYTLQGGGHIVRRGETMTMFRDATSIADVFDSRAWKAYRAAPIGATEVELVGQHLAGLLEGSSAFAYSSAAEGADPDALRDRFRIPEGAPVLLVPMSSEDELNAARLVDAVPLSSGQVSLFPGQFEWVRFVLEFARERPDLHVVVRLHPRMFPNKREGVRSPVVDEILAILDTAPPNVSVNLPSDEVSLYDLMQVVHVVLGFRSSVGAELAAYGIPVVVPANADFFTYPDEINLIGTTLDEYRAQIDRAIREGWSLDNVRRSFRWWAFLFSRIAVDMSDSVSAQPSAIRPKKPGLRLWLWRKLVFLVLQHGPLIRERIALRGRSFPRSRQALFYDVLEHRRDSLADSSLLGPVDSTMAEETGLLERYLRGLADGRWKGITEDSLAERIRRNVGATTAP